MFLFKMTATQTRIHTVWCKGIHMYLIKCVPSRNQTWQWTSHHLWLFHFNAHVLRVSPLLCWIAGGFPSIGFVHILQKGWVNWGPSVCSQASQTAQEADSRWQLGQEMRGTKCGTTRFWSSSKGVSGFDVPYANSIQFWILVSSSDFGLGWKIWQAEIATSLGRYHRSGDPFHIV